MFFFLFFFECDCLKFLQEVSGVGPRAKSITVSSEGDAEAGNIILDISDRLVTRMVQSTFQQTQKSVQTLTVGKRRSLYRPVHFTIFTTDAVCFSKPRYELGDDGC